MKYVHKKNREWTAGPSGIARIFSVWHGEALQSYIPDFFVTESHDWEPIKEPLFVTIDGAEVFDGMLYCYIHDDWSIVDGVANKNLEYDPDTKRFRSEQAAKDWVVMNKPVFSARDIIGYNSNLTDGYIVGRAAEKIFPQEEKTDEA